MGAWHGWISPFYTQTASTGSGVSQLANHKQGHEIHPPKQRGSNQVSKNTNEAHGIKQAIMHVGPCSIDEWRKCQYRDATRLQSYIKSFLIRLRFYHSSLQRKARLEYEAEKLRQEQAWIELTLEREKEIERRTLAEFERRNLAASKIQV